MAKYLLDSDVIGKKDGPNGGNIRRWLAGIDDNQLALSALTIFEVSRGVQLKRDAGEVELADRLQDGLANLRAAFADRTFPLDATIAEEWGRLAGSERAQWVDRGLIATARTHGLILVTCNSTDMKGRGVEVINPQRHTTGHWAPDGSPI